MRSEVIFCKENFYISRDGTKIWKDEIPVDLKHFCQFTKNLSYNVKIYEPSDNNIDTLYIVSDYIKEVKFFERFSPMFNDYFKTVQDKREEILNGLLDENGY